MGASRPGHGRMGGSSEPETKVLFVLSTLGRCAVVGLVYSIAKHLDRSRFRPVVLTLSPEPEISDRQRFIDSDIPVDSLSLSRLSAPFAARGRIAAYVRRNGIAVVHTNGLRPDSFLAPLTGTIPVVSTVHWDPYEGYPSRYGPTRGRIIAAGHIRALRCHRYVVGCSMYVRDRLAAYGVKATFIRNGPDDADFRRPTSEESSSMRAKLGLPAEETILTSVGDLCVGKDPLTVARGFLTSGLSRRARLVFLGDGPLRAACERVASESNARIMVLGKVTNVADYLAASDFYVSASLSEGLPLSVIEALSCGLPVILSDIGPHQELLALETEAGLTFPVTDTDSLARRLDELPTKDIESMKRNAILIATNHLNARHMTDQYEQLYIEAARRARGTVKTDFRGGDV